MQLGRRRAAQQPRNRHARVDGRAGAAHSRRPQLTQAVIAAQSAASSQQRCTVWAARSQVTHRPLHALCFQSRPLALQQVQHRRLSPPAADHAQRGPPSQSTCTYKLTRFDWHGPALRPRFPPALSPAPSHQTTECAYFTRGVHRHQLQMQLRHLPSHSPLAAAPAEKLTTSRP